MAAQDTPHALPSGLRTLKRRAVMIGAAGVLAASAFIGYWWAFLHNTVSTEDAYVRADSAQISNRVSGTVSRVQVDMSPSPPPYSRVIPSCTRTCSSGTSARTIRHSNHITMPSEHGFTPRGLIYQPLQPPSMRFTARCCARRACSHSTTRFECCAWPRLY